MPFSLPPGRPGGPPLETIRFMDKEYVLPRAEPMPAPIDLSAAKRQSAKALQPGVLSQGLASGTSALAATSQALDQVALGIKPAVALKQWQSALPERSSRAAKGDALTAVTEELDAAMQPLLQGAGGMMSEAVRRQREAEDQRAAVGWLNQGARLAAKAPPGLVQRTAEALGVALKDPGLGKLFQDKVAYYQVRRTLERDPAHELAGDPRLSGVAPEVLEDLAADRQRLAEERAVATAAAASAQRRDFGRALRQGHTDVTAGIEGPAYSREDFVRLYGTEEADKRLAAWQAAQAKAPAYAAVRGKSPAEIATAKAGYAGDRSVLDAIEAADAADRQRDPAGYALRWSPGVKDSLARAAHEGQTNEELGQLRADELWEAQAALGIAEAQRSPWTLEESQAVARRWLAAEAQPAGLARSEALVTLLGELVMTLPAEQRAGALRTMKKQGLDMATPGRLRDMLTTLEQGALARAYRAAEGSAPVSIPGKPPLLQLAESGAIASDADPIGPAPVSDEGDAWARSAARQDGESVATWSQRIARIVAAEGDEHTLAELQALQAAILSDLERESGGDPTIMLMLAQGLAPDSWQRASPADEQAQAEHAALSHFSQSVFRDRNGFFLGPDGRLYERNEALVGGLELPGTLQNLDSALADAWTREAAASGRFADLAEQYPDVFVDAALRTMGGGRGGEIAFAMPRPAPTLSLLAKRELAGRAMLHDVAAGSVETIPGGIDPASGLPTVEVPAGLNSRGGPDRFLIDKSVAPLQWRLGRNSHSWVRDVNETEVLRGKSILGSAIEDRGEAIEIDPVEVNDRHRGLHIAYGYQPEKWQQPYATGLPVVRAKVESGEQFIHVYAEGVSGRPIGQWMMRERDLKRADGSWMSPEEVQTRFALPAPPTHYTVVTPPEGTALNMGVAGANFLGLPEDAAGTLTGGGAQFQFAERFEDDWFSSPQPFPGRGDIR